MYKPKTKLTRHLVQSLLLLSATTATYHQALAIADDTSKSMAVREVEKLLNNAEAKEKYPGLSISVYLEGKQYLSATSGYADIAKKDPPTHDTIFRAYSLSKGITQILAAILADTGEIDLDAPISKYVAALPSHIQPITARQLLLHRAGIRHYDGEQEWLRLSSDHCERPEEALKRFVNDDLLSSPGTTSKYSSFGYVLLSKVLESAAGKPFESLLKQRIWSPGEVERIGLDSQSAQLGELATYYELGKNGHAPAPVVDNSCKFGAGAVVAAPQALAKIFSDFYEGRFTSKPMLKQFVPATSDPCKAVSMGGEGMGGRAALFAYPFDNLVVIIMANARGGDLTGYAHQIADLVTQIELDSTAACHREPAPVVGGDKRKVEKSIPGSSRASAF